MFLTVNIPKLPSPFSVIVPPVLLLATIIFNPNLSLEPLALGFSGRNWIPALSGAFKVISPLLIISVLVLFVDESKLLNPKATWFFTPDPLFPIIFPALVTIIFATVFMLLYLLSVFTPAPGL